MRCPPSKLYQWLTLPTCVGDMLRCGAVICAEQEARSRQHRWHAWVCRAGAPTWSCVQVLTRRSCRPAGSRRGTGRSARRPRGRAAGPSHHALATARPAGAPPRRRAPQHDVAAAVAEKGLGEAAHRQRKGHVLKLLLHLARLRRGKQRVQAVGGGAGGRVGCRRGPTASEARRSSPKQHPRGAARRGPPRRRLTPKKPRSPPARALPQWLSVDASRAKAAGTSGAAAICWRKAATMACASSAPRVTRASFQLLGRRLPACLTSRCEARTWAGAPLPLMLTTNWVGRRPKRRVVPPVRCVGLLARMRLPLTCTPSRCGAGVVAGEAGVLGWSAAWGVVQCTDVGWGRAGAF